MATRTFTTALGPALVVACAFLPAPALAADVCNGGIS